MKPEVRSFVQFFAIVAATALVGWGLAVLAGRTGGDPGATDTGSSEALGAGAGTSAIRILSLSPGITEVLDKLGRASSLVGVSDYCAIPGAADTPPRVGTALTPNYEAILKAAPDLILTQEARDTPMEELAQLAPTVSLPWHTSEDLVRGIEEIGRLTGTESAARPLAGRVDRTLRGPPPDSAAAPVVLFVLEHSPGQLTEAWYVKDDTIHGDALRAAGARNAIAPGDTGVPRLSLERVLTIDPEVILLLSTQDRLPEDEAAQLLEDWRQLSTLRAVRKGKLAVVTGDRLYVTGPRVLDLVHALGQSLESLGLGRNRRSP